MLPQPIYAYLSATRNTHGEWWVLLNGAVAAITSPKVSYSKGGKYNTKGNTLVTPHIC
jgi:hypothetical protein